MKRRICVRQHDLTDCGAACLVSIAAYYGRYATIAKVRQLAGTDSNGTTLSGMSKAADQLGFEARGVRANGDALEKVPYPCIAHVIRHNGLHHYVVITVVHKRRVTIMDPESGTLQKIPRSRFLEEWSGVLLLLTPRTDYRSGTSEASLASRLWPLIRPHRSVLFQALIGAALYTLAGLATAIYVQILIDHVLRGGNQNLLMLMSISMIAILLLRTWIGSLKALFVLKTGQMIDCRLLLDYYNHLLKLPHSFFDSMRTGELISRLNDVVKIRSFINDASLQLAVNLFVILFSFALMFTVYWKLGLFLLLSLPIWMVLYLITNRLNSNTQRQIMEDAADLEAQLVESLRTISTLKQLNLETFVSHKMEKQVVRLLRNVYRSGINSIFAGNSADWLSSTLPVLTLWIGAYSVLEGVLTIGELLSFYTIIGYFTGPVTDLITLNRTVQDATIASRRLFEIMDLETEQPDNGITLSSEPNSSPKIRFRNVCFSYRGDTPVLDHLSLTVPAGKVTAIVGSSGSGKTTLFKLLLKLYPIDHGDIHINAYNLNMIDPGSLRNYIGVVPQEVHLFSGTVLDNIALGEWSPDIQHAWSVCRLLGMLPFIESLPNGFQTELGENGARLSGGQKQRIAIARALYRNPSILLLDEATSSLDSLSEHQIRTVIRCLADRGITVLLIAHRLGTVQDADQICLLKGGRVAEEGCHDELIQSGGEYRQFWKEQTVRSEQGGVV